MKPEQQRPGVLHACGAIDAARADGADRTPRGRACFRGVSRARATDIRFLVIAAGLAASAISTSCVARASRAERDIRAVLDAQAAAWNRGDIDGFMNSYWRSNDLTFSAGGRVTRGWDATIARYKSRYTTRDRMGTLSFSDLEIRMLDDDAALVLGRWMLRRAADAPSGAFSLVLRRTAGRWVIIHDHTSSDEPAAQPASRPSGG